MLIDNIWEALQNRDPISIAVKKYTNKCLDITIASSFVSRYSQLENMYIPKFIVYKDGQYLNRLPLKTQRDVMYKILDFIKTDSQKVGNTLLKIRDSNSCDITSLFNIDTDGDWYNSNNECEKGANQELDDVLDCENPVLLNDSFLNATRFYRITNKPGVAVPKGELSIDIYELPSCDGEVDMHSILEDWCVLTPELIADRQPSQFIFKLAHLLLSRSMLRG